MASPHYIPVAISENCLGEWSMFSSLTPPPYVLLSKMLHPLFCLAGEASFSLLSLTVALRLRTL